jgi:hypothetical protein
MSAAEGDFSQRLRQQAITYGNNLPNAVSVITAFVCRAKQEGETLRNVGTITNSKGGFDDLKVLSCNVHATQSQVQQDWEFGFSEKGNAIIFAGIWQSTASVSDNMLAFRWTPGDAPPGDIRISRSTGILTVRAPQRQAQQQEYPPPPPGMHRVTQEEYDQKVENIYMSSASPRLVQLGISMRTNRLQEQALRQQQELLATQDVISGTCVVPTDRPKRF